MQMNFHRKLPIPKEVKKEFPLTERMEQVKNKRDEEIRAVFEGHLASLLLQADLRTMQFQENVTHPS